MQQSPLPLLPLSEFRFDFTADGPLCLPAYAGSAWRGAFGHALKKTVCVVKNTACADCMLKASCAYSYIFETPPPAGTEKMRKYDNIPHPFVINPQLVSNRDSDHYTLNVTVFGNALRYFPYLLHAFEKAGKLGVGGKQQLFQLQQVRSIGEQGRGSIVYQGETLRPLSPPQPVSCPELPENIEIVLRTPLRIKQQGKNIHQSRLQFAPFFGSLLRRISMLTYFHTDTPLQTDFAALMRQAEGIALQQPQLRWYDWTRYSSRQQTEMNMGGLLGRFSLPRDGIEPFWPYLWLGQWTHAGKGTSMGMGAYIINAASLPNEG